MTTDTPLSQASTTNEPPSATSRLREQFLEARRQEILEAARSVFVTRGCDAASMQQIAKAAGVSAGNIYRYFPNKEALVDCRLRDAARTISSVRHSPGREHALQLAVTSALFARSVNERVRRASRRSGVRERNRC